MRVAPRAAVWQSVFGLLMLGTTACGSREHTMPASPEARLEALVEEYFDELLPLDPLYATFIGENRYNDRLAIDIAPEHIARRLALERKYQELVAGIPEYGLSDAARLTRDIFLHERKVAIELRNFPGHLLPLDQLYSLPSVFAVLGSGDSAQPFATVRDYEAFLRRMQDFAVWVDQAIENMRIGMELGIVQPRVIMEAVQRQLDELAPADSGSSVFHRLIENMPAGFSAADRQRLTQDYEQALTQTLLPAYRRLAAFVREEYLPATRTTVAWTALPDGDAWYRFLVQMATTTTMSPDEIHDLGLIEVARIREEMDRIRAEVEFEGDLKAFFAHLKEAPEFYFSQAKELIDGYRELKARIDARLPLLFRSLPTMDYEVRPVEAFRAEAAAGAFYQSPAPDGSRPGIFYVNTWNLKAQPRFGMETLSLHEAVPGHHLQQSIQLGLTSLPRFRRFGGDYVAYVEGWGLYAESLGHELGLFTDPYQYYGRLSDEMLRAMRLVVDTGLHTRGWTRERAVDYMLDNSSLARSDIQSEVDRYIANPGQALGYKIGEIRILAMRRKAEERLGVRFDIRDFHDVVLRNGALPIDVLEASIDRWLAERQMQ